MEIPDIATLSSRTIHSVADVEPPLTGSQGRCRIVLSLRLRGSQRKICRSVQAEVRKKLSALR